ncbi:MAG: GAF domain-containing sensor histidine kinase [Cytobacillus gottheilii]|uniref:GAF domain-containing sensor histidine kinase n=1 Tax=Cytobacillus gottheilii TaxID=859144 RepID=UPI003464BCC2
MMKEKRDHELQTLKEIAELLNTGTDVDSLLKNVLERLLHITELETGWIFLIDEDGNHELAAAVNLPRALARNNTARMCSGDCWCLNKYKNGHLCEATNIMGCKRIEKILAEKVEHTNGLTHHASVPLRAGNERFGILNVGTPEKTTFNDGELALLESVAFQIGTALKRIHLTRLEQEAALSAERNRLARDLHDSVNQLLFSLSLTARGGAEIAENTETKETFTYIQDLAQEALQEMRALIWQLKPHGLENGLISALTTYSEMIGIRLHTTVQGLICLSEQMEAALWRIGQEALANSKKHSGESDVYLVCEVDSESIFFQIRDEGTGFHYDQKALIPSLGLKSMKERAEQMHGSFQLKSSPGDGTDIIITLPLS